MFEVCFDIVCSEKMRVAEKVSSPQFATAALVLSMTPPDADDLSEVVFSGLTWMSTCCEGMSSYDALMC